MFPRLEQPPLYCLVDYRTPHAGLVFGLSFDESRPIETLENPSHNRLMYAGLRPAWEFSIPLLRFTHVAERRGIASHAPTPAIRSWRRIALWGASHRQWTQGYPCTWDQHSITYLLQRLNSLNVGTRIPATGKNGTQGACPQSRCAVMQWVVLRLCISHSAP